MSLVCASIVTYNPDLKILTEVIESLSKQVSCIIIFDNGSKNISDLSEIIELNDIKLISSKKNLGIAKALNELFKYAISEKYEWVLTLDQDSICDENMLLELEKYKNNTEIGIVCPRVQFRTNDLLIRETKTSSKVSEIKACITSGSLTNVNSWKAVGGFDEWMFIDYVDNDFCTRLLMNNFKIIRVHDAILTQRAGEMKFKNFLSKKILITNYSEVRNYYISRNLIYYIRKHKKNINWSRELTTFLYTQFLKLIFERNKLRNIKSFLKGIRDGFKKRI